MRTDDGNARSECLERAQAEGFAIRGKQEEIRLRQQRCNCIELAEKLHVIAHAQSSGFLLRNNAVWAIADHYELARNLFIHARKDADHILHALDGTKIG